LRQQRFFQAPKTGKFHNALRHQLQQCLALYSQTSLVYTALQ
jgi:hypothetical protein